MIFPCQNFNIFQENRKKVGNDDLVKGEENNPIVGWKMLKGLFDVLYNQSFHVGKGDDIPSGIDLVDLDSGSKLSLKSLCEGSVPLVLNFGRCT